MMRINKYLKSVDQFGLPIALTFNNEGDTFKTMCGGVLSILWVVISIFYLTQQIIGMVNYDGFTVQTIETNLDYAELGTVTHDHIDIYHLFTFKTNKKIQYDEEFKKKAILYMYQLNRTPKQ